MLLGRPAGPEVAMKRFTLAGFFLLAMIGLASAQSSQPTPPTPDTQGSTAISVDCTPVNTAQPGVMTGMVCRYRVWFADRVEEYLQQMYLTPLGKQPIKDMPATPAK
ncbi:hypothetical protein A3A39_00720 [Candidatus Kaiserbacteria bacterium RIFCSPLOWO2_01_FULL_54_13]|uniref:Ig-like domain-containing protein n=1 Tax=Candidatus Kaiserbacteria bacterium RIFCSPLOWO2_01_FULL_54_13 TaxID=1798512 RepID=A0A1F6EZU6_9BACT|nr:MAG: hypothetical protein A3A39_00720 [Candidatus Kaiserbacteria bacterium RIFCSPLOWO2_01_FULL_54_13]